MAVRGKSSGTRKASAGARKTKGGARKSQGIAEDDRRTKAQRRLPQRDRIAQEDQFAKDQYPKHQRPPSHQRRVAPRLPAVAPVCTGAGTATVARRSGGATPRSREEEDLMNSGDELTPGGEGLGDEEAILGDEDLDEEP